MRSKSRRRIRCLRGVQMSAEELDLLGEEDHLATRSAAKRERIEPPRRLVRRRWQLAQTTSHFSISASTSFQGRLRMPLAMLNRLSRRWSNSKTTGSVSPQSRRMGDLSDGRAGGPFARRESVVSAGQPFRYSAACVESNARACRRSGMGGSSCHAAHGSCGARQIPPVAFPSRTGRISAWGARYRDQQTFACLQFKRRTGIEPASSPWKGEALPLSYRRLRESPPACDSRRSTVCRNPSE